MREYLVSYLAMIFFILNFLIIGYLWLHRDGEKDAEEDSEE